MRKRKLKFYFFFLIIMRNIYYKGSFVLIESLVSSAVERQPFKLVVEGSIPSWGAIFFKYSKLSTFIRNLIKKIANILSK